MTESNKNKVVRRLTGKMKIKERVVNRLLGICECQTDEKGCNASCEEGFHCSRDINHIGNHFACGMEHRVYEWNDDANLSE